MLIDAEKQKGRSNTTERTWIIKTPDINLYHSSSQTVARRPFLAQSFLKDMARQHFSECTLSGHLIINCCIVALKKLLQLVFLIERWHEPTLINIVND